MTERRVAELFDKSRSGHVWIGGPDFGSACRTAYNNCDPVATFLVSLIHHVSAVVRLTTVGVFDRRLATNAADCARRAAGALYDLRVYEPSFIIDPGKDASHWRVRDGYGQPVCELLFEFGAKGGQYVVVGLDGNARSEGRFTFSMRAEELITQALEEVAEQIVRARFEASVKGRPQ